MYLDFHPTDLTKTGHLVNLFPIEREGTSPSVCDRIDIKGCDVVEPFRAAK